MNSSLLSEFSVKTFKRLTTVDFYVMFVKSNVHMNLLVQPAGEWCVDLLHADCGDCVVCKLCPPVGGVSVRECVTKFRHLFLRWLNRSEQCYSNMSKFLPFSKWSLPCHEDASLRGSLLYCKTKM
ncbi:uncharacterized protein LOC124312189 [Daphnia pulicaria]|uniref:uncharacterized protein LOC124312189 n=1 Tax=Daphnia pulicaria TaxID=35523 RepID=UPI001EE9C803|nr:uncharacterized protein LOC124312189 [Daphnia pulicaria]